MKILSAPFGLLYETFRNILIHLIGNKMECGIMSVSNEQCQKSTRQNRLLAELILLDTLLIVRSTDIEKMRSIFEMCTAN